MNREDVTTMFVAIFSGEWTEASTDLPVPPNILEDSREWASVLLSDAYNPYKQAGELTQKMYLGLQNSPDKLITNYQIKHRQITLYETLQDFIVTCQTDPTNNSTFADAKSALLKSKSSVVPILAKQAKRVVENEINRVLQKGEFQKLQNDSPVVISHEPTVALRNWFDQVNLIVDSHHLYLGFFKTYPQSAAFIFRPGIDWYPEDLRTALGHKR